MWLLTRLLSGVNSQFFFFFNLSMESSSLCFQLSVLKEALSNFVCSYVFCFCLLLWIASLLCCCFFSILRFSQKKNKKQRLVHACPSTKTMRNNKMVLKHMQHRSIMSHDASNHLISDPKNLFIYSYLIEGSNHRLILLLVLSFTNF